MLFKDYHIEQIRDGEKTVTRREWSDDYNPPVEGGVYRATTNLFVPHEECDCYIRVLDVYDQSLGEMTDEDAREEGDYESVGEFRTGYERVYGEGTWDPEKVVTVVEFEYAGRELPGQKAAPGGV